MLRVLVEASLSEEFEEAKTEWEFTGYIPNDSCDFVVHCELCGHVNYLGNYLISNPSTTKQLKVGSECIKRFIILNGLESQESSNQFFDNKVKEKELIFELRALYHDVITDPVPMSTHVSKFRKKMSFVLESRGFKFNEAEEWGLFIQLNQKEQIELLERLIKEEIFPGREIDIFKMRKIMEVLYMLNKVVMQKEKKKIRDKNQPKEGETWAKKGRVSHVTLSKSKVYKNPSDKYN